MKKILYLTLTFSYSLFAQNSDIKRTYHWNFGINASIDFSSGNAIAGINSAMQAYEGCASISDTCGNLLFYTDGDTVWNKNNQPMPNGTGLIGGYSTTQFFIVPQPQNDSIYYIFTPDQWENNGANGLRYSIVNINLNGGLGAVTSMNNLLFAPCSEKLAATYHTNGIDVWIVARKYGSNDFYSYLLTSSGLSAPVITSIGPVFINGDLGYMRLSPNGNKIACAWADSEYTNQTDTLDLFDFNKNSGIISNRIFIPVDSFYNVYGTEFSPDNSKLYVGAVKINPPGMTGRIYQYDISSNSQVIIPATIQTIGSRDSVYIGALGITPLNQIYITKVGLFINPSSTRDTLSVINFPNLSGTSCGFVENGVYLNGKKAMYGLPNFQADYLSGNWMPSCPSGLTETNSKDEDLYFYPNPFSKATELYIQKDLNEKNISIIIFDALGNSVFNKEYFYYSPISIFLNLKSGIYFAQITVDSKTTVKKIIVTN